MGVAPPVDHPEHYRENGTMKSSPEIFMDSVYNQVAGSAAVQTIKEMTQPARESLHGLIPEMSLFDSSETVSRAATGEELNTERAMFNDYVSTRTGSRTAEKLTEGIHSNDDGSFYNVKDGKITTFTTVNGETYSDIKTDRYNNVDSMTMPDGSKLRTGYTRDQGLTDSVFSDGYTLTRPDGTVTKPDFDTARVSSMGLFTSRFGNHHTFTGLNGTTATMDTGVGGAWTDTNIRTRGGFNVRLRGEMGRNHEFIRH